MDAQYDLGAALGQRRLEVDGAGPVRRPDFDQAGARSPDDLRDPHTATDLDQLAARDGDPAPSGQSDRQEERGGIVDGDDGVLGAGQGDQVLLGDPEAPAPAPGVAIEFQ